MHWNIGVLSGAMLATVVAMPMPAQKAAKLTGRVFSDTIMRPIAGAEVTIPTLERTTLTDDKGGFTIADIPPGIHRVRARKIGYAVYDVSITFEEGESVQRPIVLPRLTVLDTIRTVGDPNVPLSFLDHRAVGFGYFMTRSELEKVSGRHISSVLQTAPGVAIITGRAGQGWIQSKRFAAPIRSISPARGRGGAPRNEPGDPIWYPDESEKLRGMVAGCYARVYLDRTLLNSSSPAEPVNINDFAAPETLEAVEFFAGPAQTPPEYNNLNSACGVLVLHRRRSP